jgi:hypothetical protein
VPGWAEFAANNSPPEIAAYQWMKLVETALNDLSVLTKLRSLEVRFESLMSNPREEAYRIANFAELEELEKLVEFADNYIKPNYSDPKRGKIELTAAEWDKVDEIISPLKKRLGYGD